MNYFFLSFFLFVWMCAPVSVLSVQNWQIIMYAVTLHKRKFPSVKCMNEKRRRRRRQQQRHHHHHHHRQQQQQQHNGFICTVINSIKMLFIHVCVFVFVYVYVKQKNDAFWRFILNFFVLLSFSHSPWISFHKFQFHLESRILLTHSQRIIWESEVKKQDSDLGLKRATGTKQQQRASERANERHKR